MNSDAFQLGSTQKQLKKQVAYIMTCFEDTLESYNSNRRELELVLSQLLKAHKSYHVHKLQQKILTPTSHKQDIYFQYYLLNNIACCYQTKKQLGKACEYLKLTDKQLTNLESLIQKSQLDYESRKLQIISLHLRMVRAKLNLCGLYALSQKHMEALLQCSQAFGILQSVIDSICDYSMGQNNHEDFLQLQRCIKQPYSQIKQVQIRNTYWNNVMNGQSDQEIKKIFLTLFKNCHSKQQVQVRSCLGKIITKNIQKSQIISQQSRKFLKQFTIVSVMKISPVNLQDFSKKKKKTDYISVRCLHELMVLLSVANYTVSTQLRIANMCDIEAPTIQSLSAEDQNTLYRKQKRMIQAQRHHFFAIQLLYKMASNYLKECPFFNRLIKIYEQVYLLKDNIEIIPQKVDEENQISMLPAQHKDLEENEYFPKKLKESICQTPRTLRKAIGSSSKDILKITRRQKQKQKLQQDKKKVKKGQSSSKNSNQYMCLSPRPKMTARLVSQQKKIKQSIKHKIAQKNQIQNINSGGLTLKKSKKDLLLTPRSKN